MNETDFTWENDGPCKLTAEKDGVLLVCTVPLYGEGHHRPVVVSATAAYMGVECASGGLTVCEAGQFALERLASKLQIMADTAGEE